MTHARRKLDDRRILDGTVTSEERSALERKLLRMYLVRSNEEGRGFEIVHDYKRYAMLKNTGKLFEGSTWYVLMDIRAKEVKDFAPIAYHLMDTEEGLFYAKLMQLDECRPPAKHS